ncbi:MAG TPA: efflux RND transporter periplasmic adaptor subunit [Candidatus Acidoferrum sp.]|nr:efflux RND transporter periplasmic adaptor subunit [Candidatus Acidoferrum sp.]
MKKRTAVLTVIVALGVAAGVLRSSLPKGHENPLAATPVASRTMVVAPGNVEPASEEVKLGSELDGKLKLVSVDEGDRVTRGQVVAILENADYAARVELARARVAQQQAALDRLVNGARVEERREADASVREAQAVLDTATVEWQRRRSLLDAGAISRTEGDTAEREYRVAQARLEAVRERARFVNADARVDERARAEAEVRAAAADLANAEALLQKTLVRSPINGVVLRRHRKTGESVIAKDTTPIVSLGSTGALRVRVDIDETDVSRLAEGQSAYVTADAYGDRHFTGHVIRIGQILGPKNVRTDRAAEKQDTKILETLIELDPGQTLPMGLRVDAFIQGGGHE